MKKLILSLTLVMLVFLLTGCWGRTKTAPTPTTPSPTPAASQTPAPTTTSPAPVAPANQPTANQPATSAGQIFDVSIQNFAFDPSTLTIKAGDYVVWVNDDPAPHTITGDSFRSTTLNTGDSFKFRFTKAGTYSYICSIHPSMSGQIIVQ